MKPTLLAVLAIAVFAFGARSSAQAFGEAIQINQQSMQGVGSNYRIGTPGSPSSSGAGAQDAARIQFLEVPHPLPDCGCAQPPDIVLDPDPNHAGLRLAITSPSKDAAIYYTTDGWTPTQNSQRYTGPFAVSAGAHVQAIAFEAGRTPSGIASANIPAGAHPVPLPRNIEAAGSVLRKGTVLRLVTHADVTSDEAAPGDPLPLLLDESIVDGGTVLVPRGTRVEAKITRVSPAGRNGKSGVISFEVLWLKTNGVAVPLSSYLTLAAPDLNTMSQHISDPSQVHVARALPHGQEAEILPGMLVSAQVTADTALHP